MKTKVITNQSAIAPVAWICALNLGCVVVLAAQTLIPAVPVGTLEAAPTIVATGTKPTLTWSIVYPSKVSDVLVINPPGTLIPNQTTYVLVQPVCTAVDSNCFDSLTAVDPVTPIPDYLKGVAPAPMMMYCSLPTQISPSPPVDVRLSLNGGAYQQLFYGTNADIDPSKHLFVKKVWAGQTIDFGGRFTKSGVWSPFYTTRSKNLQVIALVNGSTIPTTLPLHQQAYLSSYLRPYLNASGKISIGPMSVLVMMELNETDHSDSCFDYQEVILLVTFSKQHPNNGHGNNLDGVDSSNPGQGHGGPNGEIDPSGGVDDEIR